MEIYTGNAHFCPLDHHYNNNAMHLYVESCNQLKKVEVTSEAEVATDMRIKSSNKKYK